MKSLLSRTFLAIINGLAHAVVFFVVLALLASFFLSSSVETDDSVHEYLTFLTDGTPVIHRYTSQSSITVRTLLDGTVLEGEAPILRKDSFERPRTSGLPLVRRAPWGDRIFGVRVESHAPEFWYWVHDGKLDGSAYFVAYDSLQKSRIGFLGRNGFGVEIPDADDRFPFDTGSVGIGDRIAASHWPSFGGGFPGSPYRPTETTDINLVAVSGNELLELNFKDRSFQTLYRSAENPPSSVLISRRDSEATEKASQVSDSTDKAQTEVVILFDTTTSIIGLDAALQTVFELPLPKEALDWESIDFARTDVGGYLLSHADYTIGEGVGDKNKTKYIRIDSTGAVTEKNEVETERSFYMGRGTTSIVEYLLSTLLSPFILLFHVLLSPLNSVLSGAAGSYSEGIGAIIAGFENLSREIKISLAFWGLVFPLFAAWATHRRQTRFGKSTRERRFWTGFVWLFGLLGWVGYLTAHEWPALENCSSCKEETPVNLEACRSCRAAWPEPEKKGTEVFA